MSRMCRALRMVMAVGAVGASSALAQTPLGSAYTYQGRLGESGAPADGSYDFVFRLFGSPGGTDQVGPDVCHDNVGVVDGLFTVSLDFGAQFPGDERHLEISVRRGSGGDCSNPIGYMTLQPRQLLTAVPYALCVPGIDGHSLDASDGSPIDAVAVDATGLVTIGSIAASERLNVAGNIRLQNDSSVLGIDRLVGFNDLRLFGDPTGGPDLYVSPAGQVGVGTITPLAAFHVSGVDNNGVDSAMKISSGGQTMLLDGNEIDGNSDLHLNFNLSTNVTIANGGGNVAIGAIPLTDKLNVAGNIRLTNDSDILGVDDIVGFNDLRLFGDATGGPDLFIGAAGNVGHRSIYSNVSFNVRGDIAETQFFRVEDFLGISIVEVQSDRDFFIVGDFFVNGGSKNFIIDHPLDPARKALTHNAVEGPGYYTHYHGNVVLGADGSAWVELPDYFEALNTDPSYQLTCVGGFAQVYVAQEVRDNRFQIAGGKAGMKISWQVHATRHDPYAKDHPYRAVREKAADEVGRYHYPEGHGAPPEASLARNVTPPEEAPTDR